jgi:ribosomal protein L11 methyltransferase
MLSIDRRLSAAVLDHIRRANRRQTPATVIEAMRCVHGVSSRQTRRAIKKLLLSQNLAYSYEMGCSFLIQNTQRPWQASPRIWVCPSQCAKPEHVSPDAVLVRLQAGAAFGSDGHPTTKLCLQALDYLFGREMEGCCFSGAAIDIGTGSGILALVAALFGSPKVLALDTDPCAREEAAGNVALNGLNQQIRIGADSFAKIGDVHHLIMANLRFPTLMGMLPWVADRLHPEGKIIVSGFLREESPALERRFRDVGLAPCWEGDEKRWAGGCFAWSGVQKPKI